MEIFLFFLFVSLAFGNSTVLSGCKWTTQVKLNSSSRTFTLKCAASNPSTWITTSVAGPPLIKSIQGNYQLFVLNRTQYERMNQGETFDCGWAGCSRIITNKQFQQSIFVNKLEKVDEKYELYLHIVCDIESECILDGNIDMNKLTCSSLTCCHSCGYGNCVVSVDIKNPFNLIKPKCDCGSESFGIQCTTSLTHDCACDCTQNTCENDSGMICNGIKCIPVSSRMCTLPCAAEQCCPVISNNLCVHSPSMNLAFSSSNESFFSPSQKCECEEGWKGDQCDIPICSEECVHGKCVLPNICECEHAYKGKQCDISACNPPCVHGICDDDLTCTCYRGAYGTSCASSYTCDKKCVNGVCVKGGNCYCDMGFVGPSCDYSVTGIVIFLLILIATIAAVSGCVWVIKYGDTRRYKKLFVEMYQ